MEKSTIMWSYLGQTWTGFFEGLITKLDECRVEYVGLYLIATVMDPG